MLPQSLVPTDATELSGIDCRFLIKVITKLTELSPTHTSENANFFKYNETLAGLYQKVKTAIEKNTRLENEETIDKNHLATAYFEYFRQKLTGKQPFYPAAAGVENLKTAKSKFFINYE